MKEEIGVVELNYDQDGNIKTAKFEPTLQIEVKSAKLKELFTIHNPKDVGDLKSRADSVFSMFFSKINEIELADREQYEVQSSVETCEHYQYSDVIKTCRLKYYFVKLSTAGVL